MSDQQPGDEPSAAGTPDPTPADAGTDASTVDAPARWSGSAAVPPAGSKKSRFARRQARLQDAPGEPDKPDDEGWKEMTPVDPWAGLDAPWDMYPLAPDSPLPPTQIDQSPSGLPPTAPAGMPPWVPQAPTGAPPWTPQGQTWTPQGQNGAPPQNPQGQNGPVPWAPAAQNGQPPAWTPVQNGQPPAWAQPAQNSLPPAPPWMPQAPQNGGQPTAPPSPPKKKRRNKEQRPLPPPPPWATAPKTQRPLPAPPRRKKRHWGRRFLLLSLLGVFCCCGLPMAYAQVPSLRQYPVTAVLPKTFADLDRRDDGESKRAAARLAEQLRGPDASTKGVFTGVYGDDQGKRITVFGVTGFRLAPGSDVRAQLNRVADGVNLTDVESFSLGEAGAHERCGVGRVDDTSMVVCAWADHGSLATVLLTRRSVDDSAALVAQLRSAVLTPLR